MKGAIQSDPMLVNNYQMLVLGLPTLTLTKITGLDEKLTKTELPDFTAASGGRKPHVEFTGTLPMHHVVEQAAMEAWFREGQDPVSPLYKKVATIIYRSSSGLVLKTYQCVGLFVFGRKNPDMEMHNEGTMAENEWSFSADDVLTL